MKAKRVVLYLLFFMHSEVMSNTVVHEELKIHDIYKQLLYKNSSSQKVIVDGIVTASYQQPTQLKGFFVQEEDFDQDSDKSTSEAIFVFCDSCTTPVKIGDRVKVSGELNQHFNMVQLLTRRQSDIVVISENNSIPNVTPLAKPSINNNVSVDQIQKHIDEYYHSFQGMLVEFDQTLVVSNISNLIGYGEIILSKGQRARPLGDMSYPSEIDYQSHQIEQLMAKVVLDDDSWYDDYDQTGQSSFWPSRVLPVDEAPQGIRVGSEISHLKGILHLSYLSPSHVDQLEWRIRPVEAQFEYDFISTELDLDPPSLSSSFKVVSFDLGNYFHSWDKMWLNCGPDGEQACQGADSINELERQTSKIVKTLCPIDADIIALTGLENPSQDDEFSSIQYLTEALNKMCDVYSPILVGSLKNTEKAPAFLYRSTRAIPVGELSILSDRAFLDPSGKGAVKNQPAVAQSFREIQSSRIITIMINHLASKKLNCGSDDEDIDVGQGGCNLSRTLAAQYQLSWLSENPTQVDSDHVLIVGNFNAYRYEDPMLVYLSEGYLDISAYEPDALYTYDSVIDGLTARRHYALANESLLNFVSDTQIWNINADASDWYDYNDDILDPGETHDDVKKQCVLSEDSPIRAAVSNPIVIGFDFPTAPKCHQTAATVYVEDGMIVGGAKHGQAFRGYLPGTSNNDVIVGTLGDDVIYAGKGNDMVCASGGDDWIFGGEGRDLIYSEAGNDRALGGKHHDSVFGGLGDDILFGNDGNDILDGGGERNVLFGGQHIDGCMNGKHVECEDEFSYQ